MMSNAMLVEVSLIMFVATTFRTSFGFGEALIAVPLLSLLLPVKISTPMVVLASILIALVAVIRDWKHIHFNSAKKLLLATAVGIPFGLVILRYVPEGIIKALLGIFLILFSMFSIFKSDLFGLKNDRLIWIFGFIAGITGGSYAMNGPPLAIYGACRRWSPKQFRATIQAYFLPASLLGMIGYFVSGLWTKEVTSLFMYSLPAIVVGIFAGNVFNKIMDKKGFEQFLYIGLTIVGGILLFQSLSY